MRIIRLVETNVYLGGGAVTMSVLRRLSVPFAPSEAVSGYIFLIPYLEIIPQMITVSTDMRLDVNGKAGRRSGGALKETHLTSSVGRAGWSRQVSFICT